MGFCVTLVTSGSMADTWNYLGKSDLTLHRTQHGTWQHHWSIWADFVCGITSIKASRGYTQLPKNSFMVKVFADKDNVIASFISSSYYESFMQVLEAFFSRLLLWKMDYVSGKLNWESIVALLFIFERTALPHSSSTVCGTWFFLAIKDTFADWIIIKWPIYPLG